MLGFRSVLAFSLIAVLVLARPVVSQDPQAAVPDASQIEAWTNRLDDVVESTRIGAVRWFALHGRVLPPDQAPGLLRRLVELTRDDSSEVRWWASAALTRLSGYSRGPADAVPALIAGLGDPRPARRFRSACLLERMGWQARSAATHLVAALDDADASVRAQAAATLHAIGWFPCPPVGALVQALDDPVVWVRRNVVLTLRRYGPCTGEHVHEMIRVTADPDPVVRRIATYALGSMDLVRDDVIARLRALLHDPDTEVNSAAAHSLIMLGQGDREVAETLFADCVLDNGKIRDLSRCGGEVEKFLRGALASPDARARRAASWLLHDVQPLQDSTVVALASLASDTEESVAIAAASTLSFQAAELPELKPVLAAALEEAPPFQAAMLLEALAGLCSTDPDVPRIIVQRLWSEDERVRSAAKNALWQMEELAAPAIPDIQEKLRSTNPTERQFAALALWNMGPAARQCVPDLIEQLTDPDPETRGCSATALGRLGEHAEDAVPQLSALLASEDEGDRANAMAALRDIGGSTTAVVLPVALALSDASGGVRSLAGECLRRMGPAVGPCLAKALIEPGSVVRVAIAQAMEQIGGFPDDVLPAIREVYPSADSELRRHLLRAARAMRPTPAPACTLFSDALGDPDPAVRLEAVLGLASEGIAHADRGTSLPPMLADADLVVRCRAAVTLWKVDPQRWNPTEILMATISAPAEQIQQVGIRALMETGLTTGELVGALVACTTSSNRDVRDPAIHALGGMGVHARAAVGVLMERMRDPQTMMVASRALISLGPQAEGAVAGLIGMLSANEEWKRRFALHVLVAIGPGAKAAVPALVQELGDPEPGCTARVLAARALAAIGPAAREALPALRRAAISANQELRAEALEAIEAIGR